MKLRKIRKLPDSQKPFSKVIYKQCTIAEEEETSVELPAIYVGEC